MGISYLRSPGNISVGKIELWEMWDCNSVVGPGHRGNFESIFREVMAEGIVLSKRRWRRNVDVHERILTLHARCISQVLFCNKLPQNLAA